jgi:hypothetical protein
MATSILEYLASLKYATGSQAIAPREIGHVTVGKRDYAVGSYRTYEGDTRLVLLPVDDRPDIRPASYVRSSRTLFVEPTGKRWFIAGWSDTERVLWLHKCSEDVPTESTARTMTLAIRWSESFETALRLSSPEVLARIVGNGPECDWRTVVLNFAANPDWSADDHIAYLNEHFPPAFDDSDRDPIVSRWVNAMRVNAAITPRIPGRRGIGR